MALKRVPRRGTSFFPLFRHACSFLYGILLLLSSLILLGLSCLCRHSKLLLIFWVLLVTIGQVKDVIRHSHNPEVSTRVHFSDIVLPHRKFLPPHKGDDSSTSVPMVQCHRRNSQSNGTRLTFSQWLDQDPLEMTPFCESTFITQKSLRSRTSVNLKQPVQVFVIFGSSSDSAPTSSDTVTVPNAKDSMTTTTSSSVWDRDHPMEAYYSPLESTSASAYHVMNTSLSTLNRHKGVKYVAISNSGKIYRNQWLGERDSYKSASTTRSVGGNHKTNKNLRQSAANVDVSSSATWRPEDSFILPFGYLLQQAIGTNVPILILQVDLEAVVGGSQSSCIHPSAPNEVESVKSTSQTNSQSNKHNVILGPAMNKGIGRAKRVMSNIEEYYPGISTAAEVNSKFHIAGVVLWWDGMDAFLGTTDPSDDVTFATNEDAATQCTSHLLEEIDSVRTRLDASHVKTLLLSENSVDSSGIDPIQEEYAFEHQHQTLVDLLTKVQQSGDDPTVARNDVRDLEFSKAGTAENVLETNVERGIQLGWAMTRLLRNYNNRVSHQGT